MSLPTTKWKDGQTTIENWRSAYAQLDWKRRAHHERRKVFLAKMPNRLFCQVCSGEGGWTEPVLDFGIGPWVPCGFCEGTGLLTPHERGLFLRESKREKQQIRSKHL